jgi:flagellar biosynthesis protein FlhF
MSEPVSFIASSAEEAVAQIRERLGPTAVVLNVRQQPANGLARLWQKPMIEVLAHVPETAPVAAAPLVDTLAEFRQQLNEIKEKVGKGGLVAEHAFSGGDLSVESSFGEDTSVRGGHWRVGTVLPKTGLLPLHAQFMVDQLRLSHGEMPPASLGEEIHLAKQLLAKMWRRPRPIGQQSLHLLVGPAGSGKTTYLTKWLTQTALIEGRTARVWRLDGATANMAEALSVHCEILNVPAERCWAADAGELTEEIGFIDLPGVDWRNPLALKELAGQVKQFGMPHVHLVLNGAYDMAILQAQLRAFAALPVQDICLTHLDEEQRWGKVWNFVLGANYTLRHFSTGQNIPGDFFPASPERVFERQFPNK